MQESDQSKKPEEWKQRRSPDHQQLYFSVKLVVMPGPRLVPASLQFSHRTQHILKPITSHTSTVPTHLLFHFYFWFECPSQRILQQESNLSWGAELGLGEKFHIVIHNSTQEESLLQSVLGSGSCLGIETVKCFIYQQLDLRSLFYSLMVWIDSA